jgi:hypothetical protein
MTVPCIDGSYLESWKRVVSAMRLKHKQGCHSAVLWIPYTYLLQPGYMPDPNALKDVKLKAEKPAKEVHQVFGPTGIPPQVQTDQLPPGRAIAEKIVLQTIEQRQQRIITTTTSKMLDSLHADQQKEGGTPLGLRRQLYARWQCNKPDCPTNNFPKGLPCYRFDAFGGTSTYHYLISEYHINAWAMDLGDGACTLEVPTRVTQRQIVEESRRKVKQDRAKGREIVREKKLSPNLLVAEKLTTLIGSQQAY